MMVLQNYNSFIPAKALSLENQKHAAKRAMLRKSEKRERYEALKQGTNKM